MDAITLGLIIVVGLLPALPLRLVSNESLARARDFWLLLMLAVGTIWAAVYIPPFWPIGVYFLWWWRSRDQLPSLVTHCSICIFFFGVGRVPASALSWIPLAWLAFGAGGAVVLAWQWWYLRPAGSPWWNPYRPFHGGGWWGQRTLAACVYALLVPFFWPWGLLVAIPGLLITSSWAAILAAVAAAVVVDPSWTTIGGGSLLLGALAALLVARRPGFRPLEWLPRGDSLDSLGQRVTVAKLLVYAWTNPKWWFFGMGPRSMEAAIMRWASKIGPDKLPLGQPHNELGHFAYEYGPPGILALIILAAKLIPRLHWGDPWTACIVAGAILASASIPFRYIGTAGVWLTAASVVYWR